MRINKIRLDKHELPETITVKLSLADAAYLVRLTGQFNDSAADAVHPGGGDSNSSIYDCLDSMFNQYWENGVDEVLTPRP